MEDPAAAVILLCTVAVGVTLSQEDDAARRPVLAAALRTLPAPLTANVTDWTAVRSVVGAGPLMFTWCGG